MTKILIINGHPDCAPERFAAALCDAYAAGATAAGHQVERIAVGTLPPTFLARAADFAEPATGPFADAQQAVAAADHLVVVYPLWLGTMPARLKAFFELIACGRFFIGETAPNRWPAQKMRGKSARIIVTMGMPGLAYRLLFGAHSLRAMEAGIFRMAGFRPVRSSVFGSMGGSAERHTRYLAKAQEMGRRAA